MQVKTECRTCGRRGLLSRTVSRRAPLFQTTERLMSVPACIVEFVTSSLTTSEAAGMTLPNPQSRRVRETKSRDARGAVGCGASRSNSTTGVGVDSTADSPDSIAAATIRWPPRGWALSVSRTLGYGEATATGVAGQSRTCLPAIASISTASGWLSSSVADRLQTTPRGPSANAIWIARSRS